MLAAFTWGQWLLGLGIIGVCGFLILIVLVQQASGGGLVGAFGGGGGGSAFGAKTGDVFTVITVALAAMYLFLTVIGNYVFEPVGTAVPSVFSAPPPDSDAATLPVEKPAPSTTEVSPKTPTESASRNPPPAERAPSGPAASEDEP